MLMLKTFKGFGPFNFAIAATVAIIIGSIVFSGWYAILPVTALALIEIIFSFENAVINSQVLSTMRRVWRVVFLTVGILIAVFLVRAILPLVLVSTTIDESLSYVWDLALHNPEQYGVELEEAYPVIAAFGSKLRFNFFCIPGFFSGGIRLINLVKMIFINIGISGE